MTDIPYRYVNREISWLSFNERVLQEAADSTTPLIERIKFLGIFSSNLDEFFRVRVATVTRLVKARKKVKALLGEDPKDVLNRIQEIVVRQQERFAEVYQEIRGILEKHGIVLVNEKELDAEQEEIVRNYFTESVRPHLFPIMIDSPDEFPTLKDHSIYLAVRMRRYRKKGSMRHAIIEIPTDVLSRFFVIKGNDGNTAIILLDDVIRLGLKDIFSMFFCNCFDAYTIKLTRDAELEFDDDITISFFEKMSQSLEQRKSGAPVRFILDEKMPKTFLQFLARKNNLSSTDTLISGKRYHNFKDFMGFPKIGPPDFMYDTMPPVPHEDIDQDANIFSSIRKHDILMHYPYHSFHHFVDFLREASIDPDVVSVKVTLYRVAKESQVINALINAARNGKKVTVVIELQARFDEAANIHWTTRLRDGGVRIIHGVPGLKVHCKLCLVERIEKQELIRYATLGTGNLNENTARIYSDHMLLTTDEEIAGEVAQIFEFFNHNYKTTRFSHLLVSPFYQRKKLMKMVKNEMSNAKKGRDAWILLKINSLHDKEMIDLLYDASSAGVKIQLIVRGICSLIPGVKGMSENISVISIVDRFLEHTRIFMFCNNGDEKHYISSADWMTRNLDRRVEVACPIYDESIRDELRKFIEIQLSDCVKARVIDEEQNNSYVKKKKKCEKVRSQYKIYDYLKDKSGRKKEKE